MAAIPSSESRYGGRAGSPGPPLPPISVMSDEHPGTRPFPSLNRPSCSESLSPSASSIPMAIRGAVQHEVPPPLPPPRYVPPDCPVCPSLQGKERMRREEYGASDTDSFGLSFRRPDFSLRNEPPDDGYHSLDSTRLVLLRPEGC